MSSVGRMVQDFTVVIVDADVAACVLDLEKVGRGILGENGK